jgi:hypothetical protein
MTLDILYPSSDVFYITILQFSMKTICEHWIYHDTMFIPFQPRCDIMKTLHT